MSEILATLTPTVGTASPAMTTERIGDLFDAHQQRLYGLARRLSSDAEEAKDLVQETFLRAARNPGSLPLDDKKAEAWLVRVLVNLCRDRYRRLAVRRRPEVRHKLNQPEPTSPESRAVARTSVQAALAHLRPKRRAVIVLRELEGLPVAEVSRLLGMNPGTVRWHHSSGRKELARHLATTAVTASTETAQSTQKER
jgi:RNA polymerase sigma-70 factor (ECF subfamily)